MHYIRAALAVAAMLLILQGCEDDPILDPVQDDSGGGSYGNLSALSAPTAAPLRRSNPKIF